MDQTVILQRILQILQQKIAMGAGEGGRMRRRLTNKRVGGYLDEEDDGGVMAGVSAGRRKYRKRKTSRKSSNKKKGGVSAGKRKKGGVSAGKKSGANKWIKHVQDYQKSHNCSYAEAMSKAKKTYKK